MESQEVNDFRNSKPHHNEKWFANAILVEKKTASDIANELNISTSLVNILIKEYGLPTE